MNSKENIVAGLDHEVAVLRRVEFRGRGCHGRRCGSDPSRGLGDDNGASTRQAPGDDVIVIDYHVWIARFGGREGGGPFLC